MACLALGGIAPAVAQDAERIAMGRVRLTTDAALTHGCTPVGWAHDDSLKDLRRKIVRAGGNTALLTFRPDDLSVIVARIFRCAEPAPATPAAPTGPAAPTTPGIPPPPPGPPPPPPPPPR